MVRVFYSDRLKADVLTLNDKQQAKLARLVVLLRRDPFHPQLHTKSLSGKLADIYSFRVGRDIRILFRFTSSDEIYLIKVGHRKDIYK